MNNKYVKILSEAKELIKNMNDDIFLDKFLELQNQNKVTHMKYVVMMNGCGAFGSGDGKNEAIENAMKYIDEESEIIIDVEYDGRCVGDASIYVVKCPDDELYQYAINDGSQCYYDEKLKKLCRS